MEFLKVVKRRSVLSEILYVALNIGVSIALLIIVRTTSSLLPAFLLVLLSHWRVLAVRVRFWFANIQANLVSVIVGMSYVVFQYIVNSSMSGGSQLAVQSFLAVLYACWLLFLKPRSKRFFVVSQAGVALFCGITAVYSMSYDWPASLVVLFVWLIGYATARHILSSYDESHLIVLSLAWAFVLAEIGWLAYHLTIAYRWPVVTTLLLPQVSIIMSCFGFLVYKVYDSYFHNERVRLDDVFMPITFTINIIVLLALWFSNPLDTTVDVVSLVITLGIMGVVEGVTYVVLRQNFYKK